MIRGFSSFSETTLRMKIDDILDANREVEFGSVTDDLIKLLGSDEVHNRFYYDPDFDVKKVLEKVDSIKVKLKLIEENTTNPDQCELISNAISDIKHLDYTLRT